MRVKALINIGTNDFAEGPIAEGDEFEPGAQVAAKLIANGWAVDVTPEPEPEASPAAVEQPVDNFTKMRAENVGSPKTKPASK